MVPYLSRIEGPPPKKKADYRLKRAIKCPESPDICSIFTLRATAKLLTRGGR